MAFSLSVRSQWVLLLGNVFEHYDAALFALLSPFLSSLFFPEHDPVTALILTFCIIPLGMLARPLGSLFFGYIGDKRSRKEALALSLGGMATVTGFMGFIPTYEQAGIFAPILLSVGRLLQNFFGAGESAGSAIYLIENSPDSRKDIMSSYYHSSTVAGVLCASAGVSLLSSLNLVQEYWRVLYFIGCLTAIFVAYLRIPLKSLLTHVPNKAVFQSSWTSLWEFRGPLLAIAITSGFSYACYSLSLVFMNGFIPLISSVTKNEMLLLNTGLLWCDFLLLPLFGLLAQKFSREKMMLYSGLCTLIFGMPLLWMLEEASFSTVVFVRFACVVIGVWFSAPLHAWFISLVPQSHRYTLISFGYAIGSQILGGPTAAISLWLFQQTNAIVMIGMYWMLLGAFASYFVINSPYAKAANQEPNLLNPK